LIPITAELVARQQTERAALPAEGQAPTGLPIWNRIVAKILPSVQTMADQ